MLTNQLELKMQFIKFGSFLFEIYFSRLLAVAWVQWATICHILLRWEFCTYPLQMMSLNLFLHFSIDLSGCPHCVVTMISQKGEKYV